MKSLIFSLAIVLFCSSSFSQPQTTRDSSTSIKKTKNVENIPQLHSPFSFALLGDLPYGIPINEPSADFTLLTEQINADNSISWVLHAGDIKTGISMCSNAMFEDRKKRFEKFNPPFVLTPGDNEWIDCGRLIAGSYRPLERLGKLRELFFSGPQHQELKHTLNAKSQVDLTKEGPALPENITWVKNGIRFATVHVTGSLNGASAIKRARGEKEKKDIFNNIESRKKATKHWLKKVFKFAEEEDSLGVFLLSHANPGLTESPTKEELEAYNFLQKRLAKRSKKFGKPVVFAHGDSHYFRIDKPKLNGKKPPSNFLRIETFGDTNKDWIKVTVNPLSQSVFQFEVSTIRK